MWAEAYCSRLGCRAESLWGALLQATGLDFVILNRPHVHGTACKWLTGHGEKDESPLPCAVFVLGCPRHPHVCTQVLCRLRPVLCAECAQ